MAEQVAQIRADLQKVDRGVLSAALIDSPLPDREKRDLLKQVLDAQTDMDALNSLSYVALAAHANDLALAAATRVVAARRDAQRLDTLAECNHVMGLTKEALALEDEALGLAAGSSLEPLVRANRKRFETGTEPAPEVLVYADRARALWKQVDDADEVPASAPLAPLPPRWPVRQSLLFEFP